MVRNIPENGLAMNDMGMDPINGPMVPDMMVSSGKTKPTAKEPFDFLMEESMRASGDPTVHMVMAATGILTRQVMMASGAMTSSTVKVLSFGQMVLGSKGSTERDKRVAKADSIGPMDPAMKVTSRRIPFMGKGCTAGLMEKSTVVNGPKTE